MYNLSCFHYLHCSTMKTKTVEVPLVHWLLAMAMSFTFFMICVTILGREKRNRQRQPTGNIVPSKLLSIFSYCCILLGPFNALWSCWRFLPGFCYTTRFFWSLSHSQFVAMECYQLSRLYYCFSRNQVHSDKGYPNWIFIFMFTVLVIWMLLDTAIANNFFTKRCWIRSDGVFVEEMITWFPGPDMELFWSIHILYFGVDITTALLYWYKIRSLRRYQMDGVRAVYDRIQCILHRVLILTAFYLFISSIFVVLQSLSVGYALPLMEEWAVSFTSVMYGSVSYSMFLMQDHNTSGYIAFLRIIKRYKCIWCFCCFGPMVNEQYRMLVVNEDEQTLQEKDSIQTWNTHNVSDDIDYNGKKTGMELSVATKTVINVDSVNA